MYGVSTSAFQIEGDDGTQGRGKSVWDCYCERDNTIHNNENAKVACDHYNLYKKDVALMKELGINAYRFSISWPRILPNGVGKVNERGINFYQNLVDELLNNGIMPYVTLYHWDLPEELSKRGGLQNPDFSDWFKEYTEIVVDAFGDNGIS